MATDSHGMGIPLPDDSTKIHEFPKVARAGFEKVAEVMAGGATDAMAGAAAGAVGKEIARRDLVEGSDPRLPSVVNTPNHLAVLRDVDGRETWLGARATDGGPTDQAMAHIGRRLGHEAISSSEWLFALVDSNRNMTDLALRASDGQFADYVVDRLRPRILEGFTGSAPAPVTPPAGNTAGRVYADAPYAPGSDVFPVKTDMKRAAGFGSSSMQNSAGAFGAFFAGRNIDYFDGGKGSELIQHTAARMGAVPALVTIPGNTIPAAGAVDVTVSNIQLTGALKAYPGTLAGVPGVLSNRALSSYVFTRTGTGSALTIPADTPFIPDAASYRDALAILWMGKNNMGATDAATTVPAMTAICFDWLAPLHKRALVLGHFTDTNTAAGGTKRANTNATNEAYRRRYGRLFVDVNAYLTGAQVWKDTRITPTAADLEQQTIGNKPPSLSMDNGHLNDAGNAAVINYLIAPKLAELGWN